jgi:hypothetical protein
MEKTDAVAALAALAQESRLDIFRLLIQAGPEGLAAGQIGERLSPRRSVVDLYGGVSGHERADGVPDRELLRRHAMPSVHRTRKQRERR